MSLGILVVEDDTDARETLVLLLRALGHRAEGCADVASARSALAARTFDLALIDYTLPDGNGAEVARSARAIERSPRPYVVGLTGWAASQMEEGERACFDRVAQKPIRSEQLKELIREATARREPGPP